LSVLPPRLPPPYAMSGVDRRPPSESTSRKLRALQHSKIEEPLFSSPHEDVRRVGVLSRGTVPRVWLPFLRPLKFPNPWKPISASDALGLRPPELSSPPVIEEPFPTLLSALALSSKTLTASDRRFSGLIPPAEPYPFLLPGCLVQDGTLALLGLSDLPGSPADRTDPGIFSLPG